MRTWFKQFLRELRCQHDWHEEYIAYYSPTHWRTILTCLKCGKIKDWVTSLRTGRIYRQN